MPLVWWGLPLAAAPLLIHLINLLRLKRVRWAAMEFLLASQRKYRTQVRLRQLLLLALRTLAVLGIVLALAQPRWRHALGRLLGGGTTVGADNLSFFYGGPGVTNYGIYLKITEFTAGASGQPGNNTN
ncbi:MAG: hypothetical protein EBR23_10155, partial [Planctomycetia bacterium]|nr:hypothetical protein [Planctomycetia bacterium]